MIKKVFSFFTISFILIFSFLLLPIKIGREGNTEINPKAEIDIEKIIQDNLKTKNYLTHQIDENNINAYNNNESIIVNAKTGEIVDIKELFVENNHLANIEKEQLNLKYPVFIIDGIKNANKNYVFSKEGLLITYDKSQITPVIEEEVSITLNCNHLNNEININCNSTIPDDYNMFKLDPNKPTIALTFDDGPNANTKIVVDALKSNKANATFFMLGMMMYSNRTMVKTVYDAGFEIGSHTYSHKYLTKITPAERVEELSKTNRIFYEITKDNIKLTRAPYGSINKDVKENLNTTFIHWSVDTLDWSIRDSQKISEYVLNNIEDGDIVLLHDIHLSTAKAVELFLPQLYAKGFQVVNVSQLAELRGVKLQKNEIYNNFK